MPNKPHKLYKPNKRRVYMKNKNCLASAFKTCLHRYDDPLAKNTKKCSKEFAEGFGVTNPDFFYVHKDCYEVELKPHL